MSWVIVSLMRVVPVAVTGLLLLNILAGVSVAQGLLGEREVTWGMFAGWLGLLTAANAVLALAIYRAWSRLALPRQVLAVLWLTVSFWYWTIAPLFFFLSMNVDSRQLAWAAFAFLWEVPVVGGGVFITLSLVLLAPLSPVWKNRGRFSRPSFAYRWTLWYPRLAAGLLLAVSVVGYSLGTLQLRLWADWDVVEQVKNIIGGFVVSLFPAMFLYLVFDLMLGKVRERLKQDYSIARVIWRRMNVRVILVTIMVVAGSLGMLGLITFDALQFLINRSQGTLTLPIVADEEIVSTFSAAVALVLTLTTTFIIFLGQVMTRALRLLSQAISAARESGATIPAVRSADELEALSQALSDTVSSLSQERNRLRDAKVETEAIFNSMGEGLVVVDKDTRVIRFNTQAQRLLGWRQEEIVGQPLKEFTQAADASGQRAALSALDEALATGATVFKSNYTYTHREGHRFPVAVTAAALAVNQEVVGAVLLFRDITREKAIDQAKTEFVSLASHQLRTPLTAMNWYVELLLRGGNLSSSQQSDLEKIRTRGQRLVRLVNDLLNVSRLEAGHLAIHPTPTDLAALVHGLVDDLMLLAAQRGCQVIFHKTDEDFSRVEIDRGLLRQALHNLVANAIKYSRSGPDSRVWVQLERKDNGAYLISVQDNGIGIPRDRQGRVFEKFFRADNAVHQDPEGAGLGLYVAKRVMAAAGGKLWFESVEGRGTTFFAEIPAEGMAQRSGVELALVLAHT